MIIIQWIFTKPIDNSKKSNYGYFELHFLCGFIFYSSVSIYKMFDFILIIIERYLYLFTRIAITKYTNEVA